MDRQPADYDQLFAAFLSGNISAREIEEIQRWQNLSVENKKIFGNSVKVWGNCKIPISISAIEHDISSLASASGFHKEPKKRTVQITHRKTARQWQVEKTTYLTHGVLNTTIQ